MGRNSALKHPFLRSNPASPRQYPAFSRRLLTPRLGTSASVCYRPTPTIRVMHAAYLLARSKPLICWSGAKTPSRSLCVWRRPLARRLRAPSGRCRFLHVCESAEACRGTSNAGQLPLIRCSSASHAGQYRPACQPVTQSRSAARAVRVNPVSCADRARAVCAGSRPLGLQPPKIPLCRCVVVPRLQSRLNRNLWPPVLIAQGRAWTCPHHPARQCCRPYRRAIQVKQNPEVAGYR